MKSYVVAESRFEADLLRRVLTAVRPPTQVEVITGGERSSAISLAKTLASVHQIPTVLVLDAETTSERSLGVQRLVVGELLRMNAPPMPIHLILADPRVEAVLFQDADALERILGNPISSEERIHALYRPREILDELLARSVSAKTPEQLLDRIDSQSARRMASHALVREIVEAIESGATAEAVPVS